MLGLRWRQKPPVGTEIDWQHPFAESLQVMLPFNEGTGPLATEVVSGLQLTGTSFGTTNPWATGQIGPGLALTTSAGGFQATINAQLLKRLGSLPVTISCCVQSLALGSGANPYIFGFCGPTGSNVFGYIFRSSSVVEVAGSSSTLSGPAVFPTSGVLASQPVILTAVISPASMAFYVNGQLSTSNSSSNTAGLAATSLLFAGTPASLARSNGLQFHWGAVHNVALDPSIIAQIGSSPNAIHQIWKPRIPFFVFPAHYFATSPTSIYENNSGGQVVTLSGTGVSWGGGTTFTVSGVAGTSVLSHTVASATSATVTIATGNGTGTLQISDGTVSSSIAVVTPVIVPSPTTAPNYYIGNYPITLTGTGTTWGGGTTFTVTGVAGVAKASQTISSATSATVNITTGPNTGTITISDGFSSVNVNIAATTQSSPVFVQPMISKNGVAMMSCAQNTTTATAITGTVSIAKSSTTLTTSSPQAGWIGNTLKITGDSSNTTYSIVNGAANNYSISPAYAGSTNAVAAAATLTVTNPLQVITKVASNPTFKVQFGGSGIFKTITAQQGPYWSRTRLNWSFTGWQLACGPIDEIEIQSNGHSYSTSPSASSSDGATLGTPLVSGGVTSFTGTGSTGWTTVPTKVAISAPSVTMTGTLTLGSTAVTGLSSTVGMIPGMSVQWNGAINSIAAIVSTTAITLSVPATSGGSTSLVIQGKQAIVTPSIPGGVLTLTVFMPGSLYFSGTPPTLTVSGGAGGSGVGTLACAISNTVQLIPLITPVQGNVAPPTITITDSAGVGAAAVAVMGGIQPSDVVTYSAAQGWIVTAFGSPAAVTNGAVVNSVGQLEPTFGPVPSFASAQRSMQLGTNVTGPAGAWNSSSGNSGNWLPRCVFPNNHIASTGPDGRPLTISGTSSLPSSLRISATTTTQVDSGVSPLPYATGVNGNFWTAIFDDLDPSFPLQVAMGSENGATPCVATPVSGSGVSTNGVTSITLGSGGSGYTSPPTVTLPNGAEAFAQINNNGQVIGVTLRRCGVGIASAPTPVFSGGGGTGASGTTTVGPVVSGQAWQMTFSQNVGTNTGVIDFLFWRTRSGTYNYNVCGECLFSPTTSSLAYPSLPSRDQEFAIDGGTQVWLTTPTPKYASVIRFMGSVLEYGALGYSSIVDPCDFRQPESFCWSVLTPLTGASLTANPTGPRTINVIQYRTYATSTSGWPSAWDSGAGVTWSSPNVYVNNPGTGTSTAVVPSSGWHGYGNVLNTDGGPFQISPANPGYMNFSGVSTNSWFIGEAVCDSPHNLKTGQTVIWSGIASYSVSVGTSSTRSIGGSPGNTGTPPNGLPIFVTGPTTFAWMNNNGTSAGTGASLPGQMDNVAGQFTVALTVVTGDENTLPFEVAAQTAGSLPGCDLWINVPAAATDIAVRAEAALVRDNFPDGRNVYVEFGNEHWNTAGTLQYCNIAGQFGLWNNSTTLTSSQAYTLRTSQVHNIWVDEFNQPDINGNTNRGGEITRLFGSWVAGGAVETNNIISFANFQNAITPNSILVDAVAVAPYMDVNQDNTSPGKAATVSTPSGSGSSLPVGSYYVYYTWVDTLTGIESDVGASVSLQFTIASLGNVATVTIPAFPSWGAVTANIYLTPTNGLPGTETLYVSGITGTTINLMAGTWSSTAPPAFNKSPSMATAAASLATHWPTSTAYKQPYPWRQSAYLDLYRWGIAYDALYLSWFIAAQQFLNAYNTGGGSSPVPALVGYEGGLEVLVPGAAFTGNDPNGFSLQLQLTTDLYFHPEIANCDLTSFLQNQAGGMQNFAVYELAGPLGVDAWPQVIFQGEPFGHGDGTTASNGIAIKNQSWTKTQKSQYSNNVAVRLQAAQDWADAANDLVIPPTVTVAPPNGSTGVSLGSNVSITFSAAMTGASFTTGTFTLVSSGTPVTGTVAYNSGTMTATFTPSSLLATSANYTATITTGVETADGTPLATPIVWMFSTVAAPTEISVLPVDSATQVPPTTKVSITFSEAMDSGTFTSSSFTLTGKITGKISYNASTDTATFTPSVALAPLTTYTAEVTTDVESVGGAPLVAPVTWEFTTNSTGQVGMNAAKWFPGLSRLNPRPRP